MGGRTRRVRHRPLRPPRLQPRVPRLRTYAPHLQPYVPILQPYVPRYAIARQRADAHPSHATGRGADCLHYCLPGVPDVYNGRLMSLLLARLEAAGLEPGLASPLPPPTERVSAPDQDQDAPRGGDVLVPSGQLLERWNFLHHGLPFVTGEPPAYALNVHPGHAPAPTDLECPLEALKPEGYRGPLLGVGLVD